MSDGVRAGAIPYLDARARAHSRFYVCISVSVDGCSLVGWLHPTSRAEKETLLPVDAVGDTKMVASFPTALLGSIKIFRDCG